MVDGGKGPTEYSELVGCLYHCCLSQALKRFSLFDKTQKFEDAVDNYTKAGNCFKAGVAVPSTAGSLFWYRNV